MQMCELAGDFLKSHQLRHFSDRQTLWTQLEDFTRTVHASLDPREAAYTIANEGRRLIECDRVSVAIRKGKKCHDRGDQRAGSVRQAIEHDASAGQSWPRRWWPAATRSGTRATRAICRRRSRTPCRSMSTKRTRRRWRCCRCGDRPRPRRTTPRSESSPRRPIGALIVEQIEDSRVTASLTHRADVVCQHSSTALANALEHQNLFLMPVWRALGKTRAGSWKPARCRRR